MTELLACPFCGSTNLKVYLNAPASDMRPWEHVACLDCGTGQTTVEKWNTRAPIVIDHEMVYRAIQAFNLKESPATAMFKALQAALNLQEKPE